MLDVPRGRPATRSAHALFFPAAAVYAAVAVPLSAHGMVTGTSLLPGFGAVAGHAHELLFGYAFAVVAGFLINRAGSASLALLFVLWLAARITFLLAPHSPLGALANGAFALGLAVLAAPQFLKAAKKLRNRLIGPLVLTLCLALMAYHGTALTAPGPAQTTLIRQGVLLLCLLMLFMSGRILAPAVAGHLQRRGEHLEAGVQPRLEGGLMALLGVAVLAQSLDRAAPLAGSALMGAAVLATIRLVRWQLWRCRQRPDLLCLGIGCSWLIAGLAMLGSAGLLGWPHSVAGTHAITVGGLGTLTAAVMVRTRLVKAGRHPAEAASTPSVTLLLAGATIARIVATPPGLYVAAALWSGAFLVTAAVLLRIPPRRPQKAAAPAG